MIRFLLFLFPFFSRSNKKYFDDFIFGVSVARRSQSIVHLKWHKRSSRLPYYMQMTVKMAHVCLHRFVFWSRSYTTLIETAEHKQNTISKCIFFLFYLIVFFCFLSIDKFDSIVYGNSDFQYHTHPVDKCAAKRKVCQINKSEKKNEKKRELNYSNKINCIERKREHIERKNIVENKEQQI